MRILKLGWLAASLSRWQNPALCLLSSFLCSLPNFLGSLIGTSQEVWLIIGFPQRQELWVAVQCFLSRTSHHLQVPCAQSEPRLQRQPGRTKGNGRISIELAHSLGSQGVDDEADEPRLESNQNYVKRVQKHVLVQESEVSDGWHAPTYGHLVGCTCEDEH